VNYRVILVIPNGPALSEAEGNLLFAREKWVLCPTVLTCHPERSCCPRSGRQRSRRTPATMAQRDACQGVLTMLRSAWRPCGTICANWQRCSLQRFPTH